MLIQRSSTEVVLSVICQSERYFFLQMQWDGNDENWSSCCLIDWHYQHPMFCSPRQPNLSSRCWLCSFYFYFYKCFFFFCFHYKAVVDRQCIQSKRLSKQWNVKKKVSNGYSDPKFLLKILKFMEKFTIIQKFEQTILCSQDARPWHAEILRLRKWQERAVSTLLSTSIMPNAHGPWWSRMPVLNHRVSLCLQLEILRRLPCMASLSRAAPRPPHRSNPVLYWGHGTRVLSTWSPVYHAGLKGSFFLGLKKLCVTK